MKKSAQKSAARQENFLNKQAPHLSTDARIFVSNLAYSVRACELVELFARVGEVRDAYVVADRVTGLSRGIGFVTMADEKGAAAAIEVFNGQEFMGRRLKVCIAREGAR